MTVCPDHEKHLMAITGTQFVMLSVILKRVPSLFGFQLTDGMTVSVPGKCLIVISLEDICKTEFMRLNIALLS
jgi:hypothetical protein